MGRSEDRNPNEKSEQIGIPPETARIPESPPNVQSNLMNRLHELGLLDDPKFTAEVLGSFLRDGLQTIKDLETAIQAQDAAACELLAHRMKGASLNLGAEELGSIALAMETLARDGDLSKTAPLIEQLHAEFERVRAFLLQLPGMPKAA
jgi:HPt (histidine-containing phosphotransfer) domain-containing protein